MKSKSLILCIILLGLYSCNQKVVKIRHYYSTNKYDYYDKDNKKIENKPLIVNEGENINIEIMDFNPLSTNIDVNQEKGVLYYQNNNFSPLMTFLKVESKIADTTIENVHKNNLCDYKLKLEIITNEINITCLLIKKSIERYKQFYNSIASLNNLIEQEKFNNKLKSECLCDDITKSIDNVMKYSYDTIRKFPSACGNTLVCENLISGDALTDQKNKYFDYFTERQPILDSLESKFKVQLDQDKKELDKITNDNIKNIDKKLSKLKRDKKIEEYKNEYKDSLISWNNSLLSVMETKNKLIKTLSDINVDYILTRSGSMDLAINKYKSIAYLEFTKNVGPFKVEDTDNFGITMSFENTITNKTTIRKINLDVIKPLKIDYSAGVFLAPNLYDENFDVMENSGTYHIKKTDGGKISYGPVGYINFHPVFICQKLSIGASIGTGLMFNNATKIVFSPTISIFVGKYQRAIFHFGLGFAQVNRVHSKYADDFNFTDNSYKPELKSETSKSLLFAITWNLSRK